LVVPPSQSSPDRSFAAAAAASQQSFAGQLLHLSVRHFDAFYYFADAIMKVQLAVAAPLELRTQVDLCAGKTLRPTADGDYHVCILHCHAAFCSEPI
jgi:hypothetical protein